MKSLAVVPTCPYDEEILYGMTDEYEETLNDSGSYYWCLECGRIWDRLGKPKANSRYRPTCHLCIVDGHVCTDCLTSLLHDGREMTGAYHACMGI